jgi:hypothetical protein
VEGKDKKGTHLEGIRVVRVVPRLRIKIGKPVYIRSVRPGSSMFGILDHFDRLSILCMLIIKIRCLTETQGCCEFVYNNMISHNRLDSNPGASTSRPFPSALLPPCIRFEWMDVIVTDEAFFIGS